MVSLSHTEQVVTHKQGLMLGALRLFGLGPGNCFRDGTLWEENTEFALQESPSACTHRKQAEQFLILLTASDFWGSMCTPLQASSDQRLYLSSRTCYISGGNRSEELEKLKILFFMSLGHVCRVWHLVLCLGKSSPPSDT